MADDIRIDCDQVSLETPGTGASAPTGQIPASSVPASNEVHPFAINAQAQVAKPDPASQVADAENAAPPLPGTLNLDQKDAIEGGGADPISEAPPSTTTTPPIVTPLKPASWGVVEPVGPWCPDGLETELGFEPNYQNEIKYTTEIDDQWRLAAASKRGRMHAHHGTFREDALSTIHTNSFSFLCVCDGAGSSKLSRIGSEFTAQFLCKLVKEELLSHEGEIMKCSRASLPGNLRAILHLCLDTVARKLVDLSVTAQMLPKDFRCTILTVLHYHHPTGGIFLFGNVGDGFIAVKRRGQSAERIGTSDSGAFSGEVTCFMPDPQVSEFYKTSLEENPPIPEDEVDSYILCTDGVEDPFFPIHRTIDKIYGQLTEGYKEPIADVTYPEGQEPSSIIHAASPGDELLKWLSYEKRGENDDRTIVFTYRKSLAEPPIVTPAMVEMTPEEASPALDTTALPPVVKSWAVFCSPQVIFAMIVGGLVIANAFLIGALLGFTIGSHSTPLAIPNGCNSPIGP